MCEEKSNNIAPTKLLSKANPVCQGSSRGSRNEMNRSSDRRATNKVEIEREIDKCNHCVPSNNNTLVTLTLGNQQTSFKVKN